MKAKIERTSDWGDTPEWKKYREFNTLEDLLNFMKNVNHPLIISKPEGNTDNQPHDFDIEIYDSWRE